MKVTEYINQLIDELEKNGTPAEYIIMGKKYFYEWLLELTRTGEITLEPNRKKYKFKHRGIKLILCGSEILEVVPNSRYLLD